MLIEGASLEDLVPPDYKVVGKITFVTAFWSEHVLLRVVSGSEIRGSGFISLCVLFVCVCVCSFVCACAGDAPNYYPNSFSGPVDDRKYCWSKFTIVSHKSVFHFPLVVPWRRAWE